MKTILGGRPFRFVGIALAGIFWLGVWPPAAEATVTTTCPGGTCSLQELLGGSTITINDKAFTNWQLFDLDTSLAQPPNLNLITVIPIDELLNPGLRYHGNGQLSIIDGLADDFILVEFGYMIQTLDGVPRIRDNSLEIVNAQFSGDGGRVDIAEFVCVDVFLCDPFSPEELAFKTVVADQLVGEFKPFDSAVFPPQATLFIDKSIHVVNDFDTESVALNVVEQRWSQAVPEPASVALLGIGVTVLALTRRRRTTT